MSETWRNGVRSLIRSGSIDPLSEHSLRIGFDPALAVHCPTGGYMLRVVGQEAVGERQNLRNPRVGKSVVDAPMLAAGLHETAPAQAGQMLRDLRLRLAKPLDQCPNRCFTGFEQLE